MATVILARHGRTAANASGVLAGRAPGIGLDDFGIKQAEHAGKRVEGMGLVKVLSSPMQRCQETARIICPDRQPEVDGGFDECDYGAWTGSSLKDLALEDLWRTVQIHPSRAQFPNGESIAQMASRAVAAIRRIDALVTTEFGADSVWMVVSHGDVIKAILNDALGAHLDAFQRIVVAPGSLSVIRYAADRPYVLTMNSSDGPVSVQSSSVSGSGSASDAVVGGGV